MSADGRDSGTTQFASKATRAIAVPSSPSAIASAIDGSLVCIGCGDGSVVAAHSGSNQTPEHASEISTKLAKGPSEEWTGGVRAMCEVAVRNETRHWLVGHLNGLVEWLELKIDGAGVAATTSRVTEVAPLPELVYVGRLDAEGQAVLISYARPLDAAVEQSATLIYKIRADHGGVLRLHLEPIKLRGDGMIERVRAVFPIAGEGEDVSTWLLLTHTAEVWKLSKTQDGWVGERLAVEWTGAAESDGAQVTWDEQAGPALVMDAVALGGVGCREVAARNQILLTTDVGVFLVRVEAATRCRALALHGAGSRGSMLAIASFVEGSRVYAWCSDSHGMTHLYRTALVPTIQNAHWQRIHVTRGTSPALQALATHEKGSAFVWQIMRNQSVLAEQFILASSEQDTISSLRRLVDAQAWAARKKLSYGTDELGTLALVAHVFEPEPSEASQLWTFLGEPNAELALSALAELTAGKELEPAKVLVRRAVRLWTETLVGSIHRLLERDGSGPLVDVALPSSSVDLMEDQAYGVIRWLRSLDDPQLAFPEQASARELREALVQAARSQVFNVRRWTFYAPRFGNRMPKIARKLAHLSGEPDAAQAVAPARFHEDRLAFEALLFAQRADDEGVISEKPKGTATDAAHLVDVHEGVPTAIVAVLWPRDRVRFYRVRSFSEPGAELERCDFELSLETKDARPLSRSASASQRQKLAFWKAGETFRLATSQRKTIDFADVEHLALYRLPALALTSDAPKPTLVPLQSLVRAMSASNALDLEIGALHCIAPDRLAIGVGSRSGAFVLVVDPSKLEAGPEQAVLAMAKLPSSVQPAPAAVVALSSYTAREDGPAVLICGCSDGRVWCVELSTEPEPKLTAAEVGQLSASVSTTAASWIAHPACAEREIFRVFAGGVDGTVVGWQRQHRTDSALPAPEFTTLWATREQEAITQLSTLEFDDGDMRPVVLAVSRDGRALLIVNDPLILDSPRSQPDNPRKPRIPGQRIERFKLRSTAFASVLVHPLPRAAGRHAQSLSPSFRLCVVAGDGRVRLVGLHQPKRSEIRVRRFQDLGQAWDSVMKPAAGGDPDYTRYRFSEALRAVAPQLYLLPVTAWFEEDAKSVQARMSGVPAHWFPRYLRPFVRAAERYGELRAELTAIESEESKPHRDDAELAEQGAERIRRWCEELGQDLSIALRGAFELRDKLLFEEIVKAFVDDFHKLVIKIASQPERRELQDACMDFAYRSLLEVCEEECSRWLAHDSTAYAQVQIARIKCVINGRVLFHLTEAIGKQGAKLPLRNMVRSRLDQIQRLLMDGHPLVPLETLRAVNLSILRACWLTLGRSRLGGGPHAGRPETYHLDIGGLIDTLDGFAARAAHGAEDALAHELARSYALCPVLSPPSASSAAFGLRAARLPNHIVSVLDQQLDLLVALLGLDLVAEPDARDKSVLEARDRFRAVLRLQPEDAHAARAPASHTWWARWGGDWEAAFAPIGTLLLKLDRLSLQLEQTPRKVKLESLLELSALGRKSKDAAREWVVPALDASPRQQRVSTNPPQPQTHFESDWQLWVAALEDLEGVYEHFNPVARGASESDVEADHIEVVDPALVLAGSALARWATAQIAKFEAAYERRAIHDPQYSIYLRSLERWAAAARGLSNSTAVQRTLVAGVLDHHLLERLDDHALSLWEAAHTLDPDVERKLERGAGTIERYAQTLVQLLEEAETVPKNLRTLYELIDDEETGTRPGQHLGDMFLASFMPRFTEEKKKFEGPLVERRTERLLKIVIRELKQNADEHSHTHDPHIGPPIEPVQGGIQVTLHLHGDAARRREQARRLTVLDAHGCRRFLNRQPDLHTSNGMGLYLASLAASSVGYRLRVVYPFAKEDPDRSDPARVTFVLEKEVAS